MSYGTAKMWHFGKDVLTSYSGQKFDISWGGQLECLSSYVFKRVWKEENEGPKRGSRISKQAIEGSIH